MLTEEQTAFHKALMEFWGECCRKWFDTPDGEPVPFPDAGHAAAFFRDLARRKVKDGQGALVPRYLGQLPRVKKAIRLFFKHRSDWYEEQKAKAHAAGQIAPPVVPEVKAFRDKFEHWWSEVK